MYLCTYFIVAQWHHSTWNILVNVGSDHVPYLNWCWLFAIWALRNYLQRNVNQNFHQKCVWHNIVPVAHAITRSNITRYCIKNGNILTIEFPYLTLKSKLWGICCEYFEKSWGMHWSWLFAIWYNYAADKSDLIEKVVLTHRGMSKMADILQQTFELCILE